MKCPTCGGRIFGGAWCIICGESFLRRHRRQITCAKAQCKRTRQLQTQKIWQDKLAAVPRFPGEFVICLMCGTKVPKVRSNQATCQTEVCMLAHMNRTKAGSVVRAKHVRD